MCVGGSSPPGLWGTRDPLELHADLCALRGEGWQLSPAAQRHGGRGCCECRVGQELGAAQTSPVLPPPQLWLVGWWARRLWAGPSGAEGQACPSPALRRPHLQLIELQAMLKAVSEGKPPEPPTALPSARAQVRGWGRTQGV